MNASIRAPDPTPHVPLRARWQRHRPLAIDGLPPALGALAAGQVHIVYAAPSPARDALFWKTAAEALHSPATVLSTRDGADIADMLRAHGLDIDEPGAVHPKANLSSLRPLPGRDGAEVLLDALTALAEQCAESGSEFLIDGAEVFFAWHDANALARQGTQLANWCSQGGFGVLLVVTPPDKESADGMHAPALGAFHAHFGGAAQLLQEEGQYTWDVAFWRERNVMLPSRSLPLRFSSDDYRLMVADDTPGEALADAGLLAPDEHRVLVSRDAVMRERVFPRGWQLLDDNDAVVAAAANAVAATVMLGYRDSEQLERLAGQVYGLRRQAGPALKIVVREGNVAMRYESVMVNLGVNLVIPRNTPIGRVESMLEAIQGQVFSRRLPPDYITALSAVLHSAERGYVSAPRFVDLVRDAIGRARIIHLPNVLLELPLLPEIAHVDALEACHMRRAGDLCTACGDSLYAFFFACRLADVTMVLQRVFHVPPADLFSGELRSGDYDSISSMLEALEDEISSDPPLDYTSWLEQQRQSPESDAAGSLAGAPAATPGEVHQDPPSAAAAARPDQANPAIASRTVPTPAALPFKA